MSQVLPRRVLVAVAILTLLGAALALAVATRPQTAQAQAGPAHDTEVFSNIVLATNSIGEIHLGPGTGSVDVLGAGCNPAGPRGGGNIPGQMVTDFRTTETILRVFHLNGWPRFVLEPCSGGQGLRLASGGSVSRKMVMP